MSARPIDQVRSFNRIVTRRIGVLNQSFLGRGRPLSEARLLYEIGHDGADLRKLRERLSLDSGYLSRLMRSLESQKLVTSQPSAADGRIRSATLTAKGRRELVELDQRSEAFAASLLAPLSVNHQNRLVSAMREVELLIQASAVELSLEDPNKVDAIWCLQQYFDELSERFDTGFDPENSISANPEELTPPAGVFLIARLDGNPIGCGALKAKDNQIGEIKRMWVAPTQRGLGVARRMLEALEGHASQLGLDVLRLETNENLKEAQALYARNGYKEVDPFNDEPYAHHWFEKVGLKNGESR